MREEQGVSCLGWGAYATGTGLIPRKIALKIGVPWNRIQAQRSGLVPRVSHHMAVMQDITKIMPSVRLMFCGEILTRPISLFPTSRRRNWGLWMSVRREYPIIEMARYLSVRLQERVRSCQR
jgi:hypothetical protein